MLFYRATQVNEAALANIDAWAPDLFPKGKRYGDTYRISSKALGRDLQEDLSISPNGCMDFGLERGTSPINIVLDFGGFENATAISAALWLCEQLKIDAVELGYKPEKAGINFTKDGGAGYSKSNKQKKNRVAIIR